MSSGLRRACRMRRTAGSGLALCMLVSYAALAAGPVQASPAGPVPSGGPSAGPVISSALPAGSSSPGSSAARSWALPAGARVLGPARRSARLSVTVALRSRDPGGLARLAQQVSTPRDPRYRHFLRPAQVRAGFGAPRAALAAVRAWLRRRGLEVGATLGDGLLVPASGPAGALEAAFRTPIVRVRLASGRVAHANRRAITLPARLRHWVTTVAGLSNVALPRNYLAVPPQSAVPAHSVRQARSARAARSFRRAPASRDAGPFSPVRAQCAICPQRARGPRPASLRGGAADSRCLHRRPARLRLPVPRPVPARRPRPRGHRRPVRAGALRRPGHPDLRALLRHSPVDTAGAGRPRHAHRSLPERHCRGYLRHRDRDRDGAAGPPPGLRGAVQRRPERHPGQLRRHRQPGPGPGD